MRAPRAARSWDRLPGWTAVPPLDRRLHRSRRPRRAQGRRGPSIKLEWLDRFGARALGPLPLGELHPLPLAELLECHTFNRGGMKKQILPASGRDESKTLFSQTLYCTFCHVVLLLGC